MSAGAASALRAPVFVVGCPRSGTTLLQRMLNAHADIAIAPETFFVRAFWLRRAEYGPLSEDKNLDALIADLSTRPEFSEMGLDREELRAEAYRQPRTFADVFALLLTQFAATRGASVIGEKTPNHLLYADTLRAFFPQARFVHIVRDARAVVNSWRTVPWSSGMLWRDADIWRKYAAEGRRQQAHDRRDFFTVRFEELVEAPEDALKPLCRFLEVDFQPAMLAFHEEGSASVNTQREPWKERVEQPVQAAVAHRWRQELDAGDIREIEAAAGREMRRWHYELHASRLRLLPAVGAVRVRKALWKAQLIFDHLRGRT